MFGRRAVQVDVVKKRDDKNTVVHNDEKALEKRREWISETIRKSIAGIALGVCAYVAIDTARQVAVKSTKPG